MTIYNQDLHPSGFFLKKYSQRMKKRSFALKVKRKTRANRNLCKNT